MIHIPETTETIDHFEKNGQLHVFRWHYEVHFDGQDQLAELAEGYSRELLDRLPENHFYPAIPAHRLHMTVQEALRLDGQPGQYSENQMCEFDRQIEQDVLADMPDEITLKIGRRAFLGKDGWLLIAEPQDELTHLRNKVRGVLGLPLDTPDHIHHVTLAYSKESHDVSEVDRIAREVDLPPAIVSVSGLTRVSQWSNGEFYDWNDSDRKLLPFGKSR